MRLVIIAGSFLVLAAAILAFTGSVVLFDPSRQVSSAQLIDGWGHKQPLMDLVYVRVGVPRIEGAVQIKCKSGKIVEGDYVTPGAPTWQKLRDRCSVSRRS